MGTHTPKSLQAVRQFTARATGGTRDSTVNSVCMKPKSPGRNFSARHSIDQIPGQSRRAGEKEHESRPEGKPPTRSRPLPHAERHSIETSTSITRPQSQALHCRTPTHGSLRHPRTPTAVQGRDTRFPTRRHRTHRTNSGPFSAGRSRREPALRTHTFASRRGNGRHDLRTSEKRSHLAVSAITHRACILEPFNQTFQLPTSEPSVSGPNPRNRRLRLTAVLHDPISPST